jgi:hypothetical protein
MQYIVTIVITLLLSACTGSTEQSPKIEEKEKKIEVVETKLPDSSEFTEYNNFEANITSHEYDIEGRYKLYRGVYMHGGINVGEITSAYLVIEKLDDDDFGYYFADKTDKLPANSTFGVFHYNYEDKKFYQRIIDGNSTVIRGGVAIVKDGDRLKITIRQFPGRKIIIWEKTKEIDIEQAIALDAVIEDARDSYVQVYKSRFKEITQDKNSFFEFFNSILD